MGKKKKLEAQLDEVWQWLTEGDARMGTIEHRMERLEQAADSNTDAAWDRIIALEIQMRKLRDDPYREKEASDLWLAVYILSGVVLVLAGMVAYVLGVMA